MRIVHAGLGPTMLAAIAVILAGCGPTAGDGTATPAASPPGAAPPVPEDGDGRVGWIKADGPGESAAIFGALGMSVEMTLTCATGASSLQIVAPRIAQLKVDTGDAVQVMVAAEAFEGRVVPSPAEPDARRVEVALTPALLAALRTGGAVRLVANDAFIDSIADTGTALAELAASCETLGKAPPTP
jgi:hypothetical protein